MDIARAILLAWWIVLGACSAQPKPVVAPEVKPETKAPKDDRALKWYFNGKEFIPDCDGWAGASARRREACMRQWLKNQA